MRRMIRYASFGFLISTCLSACGSSTPNRASTPSAAESSYAWTSPSGWQGGRFNIPLSFAPDLDLTGTEVLRFHPGFYQADSEGVWTYAFVLIVDQTDVPSAVDAEQLLETYFLGLGRNLGGRSDPNLQPEAIDATSMGGWEEVDGMERQSFTLRMFDPFVDGGPRDLTVELSTFLCEGERRRALFFALSPHPRPHPFWETLYQERSAIQCS